MEDNCHPTTHKIKRSLSVFEKHSVPTVLGKALLLPAHPPSNPLHKGEIEELVDRGFELSNIIAVEKNADIVDELYRYYYDKFQIHHEDLADFFDRSTQVFSYMHLDFCQQFTAPVANVIQEATKHLEPTARLRVSTSSTRGKPAQDTFGAKLRSILVLPLAQAVSLDEKYYEYLASSTDINDITAVVILFNHFFGMAYDDYFGGIPKPTGRRFPLNVSKFFYHEGHTSMHSMWVDLAPFDPATVSSTDWVEHQVYTYLLGISKKSIAYNPDMFMEDES